MLGSSEAPSDPTPRAQKSSRSGVRIGRNARASSKRAAAGRRSLSLRLFSSLPFDRRCCSLSCSFLFFPPPLSPFFSLLLQLTGLRRGHVRDLARPALDDQVRRLADCAGLLRERQRRARLGRLKVDVVVLLVGRLFSFRFCFVFVIQRRRMYLERERCVRRTGGEKRGRSGGDSLFFFPIFRFSFFFSIGLRSGRGTALRCFFARSERTAVGEKLQSSPPLSPAFSWGGLRGQHAKTRSLLSRTIFSSLEREPSA